jgi:hypothetical protein
MIRKHLGIAALALAVGACQNKGAEPAPAASVAAPVASAAPPSTDVPTEEDFEQTALDEINPQNMEQQLDALEKQIGK